MQPMLDHLERKLEALGRAGEPVAGSVETLRGNMTAIPLEASSVGTVFAPFNCLMHLYTWRELLLCFREVERVLRPGGIFALDVLLPDLEWLTWDPEVRHAITPFVHPRTGRKLLYSTNHSYDHDTQVCHIRIYYDADEHGGRLWPGVEPLEVVHLAHRQIFPEELRLLVSTAGLVLEQHSGDFLDLTLDAGVEVQAVVCRKPVLEGPE
jgi:SAM-dependent methyltransferase